ncbi:MAG: diguanylate cyclase [Pseudomonadota bacterium]
MQQHYYQAVVATSLAEAQHYLADEPDVVFVAFNNPKIGAEHCRVLQAKWSATPIPIIATTSLPDLPATVALHAGAEELYNLRAPPMPLIARLRALGRVTGALDELRLRGVELPDRRLNLADKSAGVLRMARRVLVFHPQEQKARQWADALGVGPGLLPVLMPQGSEMPSFSRSVGPPDAIIVHAKAGERQDGLRLIAAARADARLRSAAVLSVCLRGDDGFAVAAFDQGANDVLYENVAAQELELRLRIQLRRKTYADRLRAHLRDGLTLSVLDPLTGLHNRRYLREHVDEVVSNSRMAGKYFAIVVFDIDRFKRINDVYGHASGDDVLREFAARLRENVRGADLVARLGGEEFCLAMPDTDMSTALETAERVRSAIALPSFKMRDGKMENVTVSAGVAVALTGEADPETLISDADRALYVSKNTGRNRVTLAGAA